MVHWVCLSIELDFVSKIQLHLYVFLFITGSLDFKQLNSSQTPLWWIKILSISIFKVCISFLVLA